MNRLLAVARRVLLVPIFAAAYGWQDRLRGLPGPRIGLALPLREPSHHDAVPLIALAAVWLVAFALAARLVPVRVLPRLPAAVVRGLATFALLLALQALSLELVRQATLGFEWQLGSRTVAPAVAGLCAALATLVATPPRRAPAVAPEEDGVTAPERTTRLTATASAAP